MSHPYLIGIAGSIACGKGWIADCLRSEGVPVEDTDEISHWLLDTPSCDPHSAYRQVLNRFGLNLAEPGTGKINRALLRKAAFADKKAKTDLEAIMWPAVSARLQERVAALAAAGHKLAGVEMPLLHETGQESTFDEIWVVTARQEVQLERIMSRDKVTRQEALERIKKHWAQEAKIARCHRKIDNSLSREHAAGQVKHCLELACASCRQGYLVICSYKSCPCCNTPLALESGKVYPDCAPVKAEQCPREAVHPEREARNERYREILRRAAMLCTDDALDKMGDVATTCHKHADAQAQVKSCACRNEKTGNGLSSGSSSSNLQVHVLMTVRNGGDNTSCPESCSCGCGKTCRVSCACCRDCGCSCRAPDGKGDGCAKPPLCPGRTPCRPACCIRTALFGFLVVLVLAAAAVVLVRDYMCRCVPGKRKAHCRAPLMQSVKPQLPGGTVAPVKPPADKKPPDVVTDQPPCQNPPENPQTPVVVSPLPQARLPDSESAWSQGTIKDINPPRFALPYLHNRVLKRADEYIVTYLPGRQAILEAWRHDGSVNLLLARQEYGADLSFCRQWVMSYNLNGNDVYADLFQAPNIFSGRTVYEYGSGGMLTRATLFDGNLKMQVRLTVSRYVDGSISCISLERFNQFGVAVSCRQLYSLEEALQTDLFYLSGRFAGI